VINAEYSFVEHTSKCRDDMTRNGMGAGQQAKAGRPLHGRRIKSTSEVATGKSSQNFNLIRN